MTNDSDDQICSPIGAHLGRYGCIVVIERSYARMEKMRQIATVASYGSLKAIEPISECLVIVALPHNPRAPVTTQGFIAGAHVLGRSPFTCSLLRQSKALDGYV